MPTRERPKKTGGGKESCLRSFGIPFTSFTSYPRHRITSVFQRKYQSWRLLPLISTKRKNVPLKARQDL